METRTETADVLAADDFVLATVEVILTVHRSPHANQELWGGSIVFPDGASDAMRQRVLGADKPRLRLGDGRIVEIHFHATQRFTSGALDPNGPTSFSGSGYYPS